MTGEDAGTTEGKPEGWEGSRNDGGEAGMTEGKPEGWEGSRNDGREAGRVRGGAGMTGGMTASLQGRDEVAHLPEGWATRSFSFVIPATTFRMTHVSDALRRL